MGYSLKNYQFWGTSIFGNLHLYPYVKLPERMAGSVLAVAGPAALWAVSYDR